MFPNLNKILASTWHSVEAKYNLIDIIIVVITIIFLWDEISQIEKDTESVRWQKSYKDQNL